MKRPSAAACAALIALALGGAVSCAGASRALIVGIDTYQPEGTVAQHPAGCGTGRCVLRQFENLAGAVNDAEAMAELLTSPKFGFPAGNVALLTNPARASVRPGLVLLAAGQTSREGILAAMQRYLVDVPEKGDTVVFYAAGHGSLRVNLAGDKLTLRAGGNKLVHVDSTLVPADAYLGGYDVRDHEMTRIFHAALDKGVHLTVIFDTCHSGGIARGEGGPRQRFLAYDPRPVNDPPEMLPNGQRKPPPSERLDDPALVFSAVQQDQSAQETEPDARLPEVHGAFTAALIETLQVLPANAPATEVYQAVRAKIEGAGIAAEDPDLDAGAARRRQPLFGDAAGGSDAGKVRAAVVGTEKDGSVLLDIGMVSGVGAGSEFTATATNAQGERVRLRVKEGLGIARSEAMVVSPAGAKVGVGEVFELTKLTAGVADPLRFWVGAANLSKAEVAAAVEEVKRAGIQTVADPVEEPYTDVLSWDGKAWMVRRVRPAHSATALEGEAAVEGAGTKLGARLSAIALKRAVPAGAKLWVDLPASREIAAELKLSDPNSGARAAGSVANAQYVLAGSIRAGGIAYAWAHKAEIAAGSKVAMTFDHSPGCSTTSSYSTRSDWAHAGDGAGDGQDAAAVLNADSLRLARVHGWLQLANEQVAGTATRNFYKLAVAPAGDGAAWPTSGAMPEDSAMELALKADAQVANPLWVYVLDIDCHGQGTLLYPRDYSENQYPDQGALQTEGPSGGVQIKLRHSPTLKIGAPYGVDTMILLGTAQPLPDPTVLDFEGVSRPAARGAAGPGASPLGELFAKTSRGMRGAGSGSDGEIPMGWTIQTMTLHTVPKSAVQ